MVKLNAINKISKQSNLKYLMDIVTKSHYSLRTSKIYPSRQQSLWKQLAACLLTFKEDNLKYLRCAPKILQKCQKKKKKKGTKSRCSVTSQKDRVKRVMGGEFRMRGHMYTSGQFMLMYGKIHHNVLK